LAIRGVAFIDGEFVAAQDAQISVFDHGFNRSDVVYDVVSTWKGWFFRLDDHVERFERSCAGIRLGCPYGPDRIRQILAECTHRAGLEDAYVEVFLTAGQFRHGRVFDYRDTRPVFGAYAVPYVWISTPEHQQTGIHAHLASVRRIPDAAVEASYKNFHWGDFIRASIETREMGAEYPLLSTVDGHLAEGPGANVFLVRDGVIETPARNCLRGITRRTVLELAEELGFKVTVGEFPGAALRAADEIFLTSTAGGIMPVSRLDHRPVGEGKPGPMTLKLRDLYWHKREAGWLGTRVEALLPSAAGVASPS